LHGRTIDPLLPLDSCHSPAWCGLQLQGNNTFLCLLPALQANLLACITDPSVDALMVLGPAAEQLEAVQLQQLLALRGLLACGLLLHCLQRRHLVDYGRNRWVEVLVSVISAILRLPGPRARSFTSQPV
jgi:hypothetical protein